MANIFTMNKTGLFALLIALLIPFAGYFLLKNFSADAIQMPHKYFYDSVVVNEKGGKLQRIPFGIPLKI